MLIGAAGHWSRLTMLKLKFIGLLIFSLLFSHAPLAELDSRTKVIINEPIQSPSFSGTPTLLDQAEPPEGSSGSLHRVYIEGEFAFGFRVTPTTGSAGTINILGGVSGEPLLISVGSAAVTTINASNLKGTLTLSDHRLYQSCVHPDLIPRLPWNTSAVQRLYVAYFNRPADPVSFAVFEKMLSIDGFASPLDLERIAETYFSPSAEYTYNISGMDNYQIVDQLYQNIFGRAAEPAGAVYWAGMLTDGSITVAELALALACNAQGTDADVVSARIEAASVFTSNVNTPEEIAGYAGAAAAAQGKLYLAQISGAPPITSEAITAQKDSAIANVDASIAAAVAAGAGN